MSFIPLIQLPADAGELPCATNFQRLHADNQARKELGLPGFEENPYDVLIEREAGPEWRKARRLAREMCEGCPIAVECITDALERDEQWAHAVKKNQCITVGCERDVYTRGRCGSCAARSRKEDAA